MVYRKDKDTFTRDEFQKTVDKIISKMSNKDALWSYNTSSGFLFDEVRVYFTGRTERDAASELGLE